jgi:hypothetical protein
MKGFLQEANRLFFHPLGLALEISIEWPENIPKKEMEKYDNDASKHPNSVWTLNGIWDYRRDEEGIIFSDGELSFEKAKKVASLLQSKIVARSKLSECNNKGIQIAGFRDEAFKNNNYSRK